MAHVYDQVSARFRDPATGRFVPESQVRQAVDAVVKAGTDRVVALTRQLQAGSLDLATWQAQMMAELKLSHVAVGMVAKGGAAQMSPADYGALGARLREQYGFLRQFAADVASGSQPLDGRLLIRAELYGAAGNGTYTEIKTRQARMRGAQQARNILAASDHCAGCLDATAMGWVPIGRMPMPGSRTCRSRCRCHLEFRRAPVAA